MKLADSWKRAGRNESGPVGFSLHLENELCPELNRAWASGAYRRVGSRYVWGGAAATERLHRRIVQAETYEDNPAGGENAPEQLPMQAPWRYPQFELVDQAFDGDRLRADRTIEKDVADRLSLRGTEA